MSSQDRAFRDYSQRFRTVVLPGLLSSSVALSMAPPTASELDVRQATELGAILLLGKPMILLVAPGRVVPPGLRRAADLILDDFDVSDRASQDRLAQAIERLGSEAPDDHSPTGRRE